MERENSTQKIRKHEQRVIYRRLSSPHITRIGLGVHYLLCCSRFISLVVNMKKSSGSCSIAELTDVLGLKIYEIYEKC